MNTPGGFERFVRTMRILYFALVASMGIYAFVLWQLIHASSSEMGPPHPDLARMLRLLLAAVAVVVALAAFFLRRFLLPPMRAASSLRDPAPTHASSDQAAKALSKYFTAQVVAWAMCESVVIFGFIVAIPSRAMGDYVAFAAGAAICFAFYPPRRSDAEAVLRAVAPVALTCFALKFT